MRYPKKKESLQIATQTSKTPYMKPVFRLLIIISVINPLILFSQAPSNFWHPARLQDLSVDQQTPPLPVQQFRTYALDFRELQEALTRAPNQWKEALKLTLPLPDGRSEEFDLIASPVMAPGLAARYPAIRSFQVRGRNDRRLTGRLSISAEGFYGALKTPEGEVYIDPLQRGNTGEYYAYYTRNVEIAEAMPEGFACLTDDLDGDETERQASPGLESRSEETIPLRTYRFALACTGEYGEDFGGTVENVLASMNIALNRINLILESELAIRLVLIEENDQLIFLDPDTDPYENPNNASILVEENTGIINRIIDVNDYDVGHVFTRFCTFGVGGIAIRPSACTNIKGAGVTCFNSSNIEFVAARTTTHEIGHQFDASHSWNNCPGNDDQISPGNAFEPGSGSTIMSYAGACGAANNVTGTQEPYYNIGSLEDLVAYTREGAAAGCATLLPTTNRAPTVTTSYPDRFFIPIGTPFELTAQASDPDGDSLTYSWEQYDLGPSSPLGSPQENAPAFRSFFPTPSPTRVFPKLEDIISNTFSATEVLPADSREFTFRCTVRDNHPEAGGVDWTEQAFRATNTAGPFQVMVPNTEDMRWKVGERKEVRWDVANTDNDIVNCRHVNIRLSVDGGRTFPYLLAEKAPNNGSAIVTVPEIVSNRVRIRVEAADNIFFDISNEDFQIWPPTAPTFTADVLPTSIPDHCLPQELRFTVLSGSVLGFDAPLNLDLAGELPEGTTYSFSKNPLDPLAADTSILTISVPAAIQGAFEARLQLTTPALDTAYRPLFFSTISNDFSALAMVTPPDGTRDIQLSTPFEWTSVDNAESYDFELATSPGFGNSTIDSRLTLTDTTYQPNLLLPDNQLYFWRVRPNNTCGSGNFLSPQVFQTALNSCTSYANDTKVNISGTGLPTVESTIFVPDEGVINDLNLPFLDIAYQPVKSLRISLISPAETEVVVFDQGCGNTFIFKVGFDDDAPSTIVCPPDDGIVFQPANPLSAFIGENIQGTWTLRVEVVTPGFGATGSINSWELEFCSALTPVDPELVNKDTLFVPPGQTNTITTELLQARADNSTPSELEYIVVVPPAHGTLSREGETLSTGSTFQQADIDGFRLAYSHDGSDTETDAFLFVLRSTDGGLLPTQTFDIGIDPDAVVDAEEVPVLPRSIQLFPNPVQNRLYISFGEPLLEVLNVRIFNTHGQELLRRRFDQPGSQVDLSISALPRGMYFVHLQTGNSFVTKKIVRE